MARGTRVGEVIHYYGKISVAVVRLSKGLKTGDTIHLLGRNTDFVQRVHSMQIEHEAIEQAEAGSEAAVKLEQRARRGDSVFLLED